MMLTSASYGFICFCMLPTTSHASYIFFSFESKSKTVLTFSLKAEKNAKIRCEALADTAKLGLTLQSLAMG